MLYNILCLILSEPLISRRYRRGWGAAPLLFHLIDATHFARYLCDWVSLSYFQFYII